jgi:hypothetical protein
MTKKILTFLIIYSFTFTPVVAETITATANQAIVPTADDTITAEDSAVAGAGVGIYVSDVTGVTINSAFDIDVTSTGTVNPYGIGSVYSSATTTIDSLINSGNITSTTSGTVAGDGNSYGVYNNRGTITVFNNSGAILGTSSGYGTARGVNNTSGTITTFTNSGTIIGTGTANSGLTGAYGTYNGIGLYNHGDIAGTSGSIISATIGTLTNTGTIDGTRTGLSNNASANYSTADITTLINSGVISSSITSVTNATINSETDSTQALLVAGAGTGSSASITTLTNSGTIKAVATGTGAYSIVVGTGGTITTLNNSGTISAATASIAIAPTGVIGEINLNEGSVIIGDIYSLSTTSYTLNMDVGASKSYYISTGGTGTFTVTDLDNRPVVAGSAYAINIGSMEMASENLFQKTSNITNSISRNVNQDNDVWVEPYYSETTRDSKGSSSEIRKFKNIKEGLNAGWRLKNSDKQSQIVLNFDQTENDIDDKEHKITSKGMMIGMISPNYSNIGNLDISTKALVGFGKSETERKLLDSTSSTGERVLEGDYYSLFGNLGASVSNKNNFGKFSSLNLVLGADINSEMRESFNETLYNEYDELILVQLQPRLEADLKLGFSERSNVFLKTGIEAREIISGKTQDYSMGGTKVSYTTATPSDVYASVSVGANLNIYNDIDFFAVASARSSEEKTESYQASFGIKGKF